MAEIGVKERMHQLHPLTFMMSCCDLPLWLRHCSLWSRGWDRRKSWAAEHFTIVCVDCKPRHLWNYRSKHDISSFARYRLRSTVHLLLWCGESLRLLSKTWKAKFKIFLSWMFLFHYIFYWKYPRIWNLVQWHFSEVWICVYVIQFMFGLSIVEDLCSFVRLWNVRHDVVIFMTLLFLCFRFCSCSLLR